MQEVLRDRGTLLLTSERTCSSMAERLALDVVCLDVGVSMSVSKLRECDLTVKVSPDRTFSQRTSQQKVWKDPRSGKPRKQRGGGSQDTGETRCKGLPTT